MKRPNRKGSRWVWACSGTTTKSTSRWSRGFTAAPLGQLRLLRCYWNGSSTNTLGPRNGQTEMEFQLRNKYLFTWLAGDHNVEQHIHNIDVCNWILQAHPVSANGMGGRQYRNGREHGQIFDHHCVEYSYADGTIMISQCRQIPGCWTQVAEAAHGTRGLAELVQTRATIRSGSSSWQSERCKSNPYQTEHDMLFAAIRENKSHNETHYGALSTMTAILGRMATYSGQVVSWEDAMRSERALAPDRYAFDATPPVLPDAEGIYPSAVPGVTRVP